MDELRAHYSFSALKGIDWDALSARYEQEANAAETPEQFAEAIRKMLAELEDLHVWIEMPDGRTIHPFASRYRANFNHQAVIKQLADLQQFDRLGFTGRTKSGYGFVAVTSLPPGPDKRYDTLVKAISQMMDAPGFIVDIRRNGGGAENRAAQIAGLFADKRYLYARSKRRAGPDIDDLRESGRRYLEPATATPFTRPVICLVGPGCVSSGEGFALMMKAIDHVTLVGQPTRGASGNPRPVTLPNGVQVWFSRWISLEPDGTAIEGRGIQPDVPVDHQGDEDPTFDRAVALLTARTGASEQVNGQGSENDREPR